MRILREEGAACLVRFPGGLCRQLYGSDVGPWLASDEVEDLKALSAPEFITETRQTVAAFTNERL